MLRMVLDALFNFFLKLIYTDDHFGIGLDRLLGVKIVCGEKLLSSDDGVLSASS